MQRSGILGSSVGWAESTKPKAHVGHSAVDGVGQRCAVAQSIPQSTTRLKTTEKLTVGRSGRPAPCDSSQYHRTPGRCACRAVGLARIGEALVPLREPGKPYRAAPTSWPGSTLGGGSRVCHSSPQRDLRLASVSDHDLVLKLPELYRKLAEDIQAAKKKRYLFDERPANSCMHHNPTNLQVHLA